MRQHGQENFPWNPLLLFIIHEQSSLNNIRTKASLHNITTKENNIFEQHILQKSNAEQRIGLLHMEQHVLRLKSTNKTSK